MMQNDDGYREKVLRRFRKKDIPILAVCVLVPVFCWTLAFVLPGVVRKVFLAVAFMYSIPAVIILYILFRSYYRVKKWDVSMGYVEDVFTEDIEFAPIVFATIRFESFDGAIQRVKMVLESYGDFEEGCEEEVNLMLLNNKEKYEHGRVPVFYSWKNPDKWFVFLEDLDKLVVVNE